MAALLLVWGMCSDGALPPLCTGPSPGLTPLGLSANGLQASAGQPPGAETQCLSRGGRSETRGRREGDSSPFIGDYSNHWGPDPAEPPEGRVTRDLQAPGVRLCPSCQIGGTVGPGREQRPCAGVKASEATLCRALPLQPGQPAAAGQQVWTVEHQASNHREGPRGQRE